MNPNELLGGAALVGLVAGFWQKIKAGGMRVMGLLVVRYRVQGPAMRHVQQYLWRTLTPSKTGRRNFKSNFLYVRPLSCVVPVIGEQIDSDGMLFWRGWWPVFVSSQEGSVLDIAHIRWTFDVETILRNIGEQARLHSDESHRFAVYRKRGSGSYKDRELMISKNTIAAMNIRETKDYQSPGGGPKIAAEPSSYSLDDIRTIWKLLQWRPDDLGEPVVLIKTAMQTLVFPPAVMAIAEEIKRWKASKEWHTEKNIPWRRGWNIIGPPGTGKTSLARAVAQDNDLPVFALDLGSMNNEELIAAFDDMRNHAPCIPLMEDIDNVFHGRENVLGENGGGLSFDCLLNCMGGIERSDGLFLIVTTNHPEHLDPALGVQAKRDGCDDDTISSRPGRLDRAVYLGLIDESCRKTLASFILSDFPEQIVSMVHAGAGDTPAQFQFRCGQLASKMFWEAKAQAESGPRNRIIGQFIVPEDVTEPGKTSKLVAEVIS